MNKANVPIVPIRRKVSITKRISNSWQLYVLMIIPLALLITFSYVPMFGAQIAFKNYKISEGILGSSWVGFKHFVDFFKSYQFVQTLLNTLTISLYSLVVSTPCAIILALSLNYIGNVHYKKVVQMTTYAPHFISVVVMIGILMQIMSPRGGILNAILGIFGIGPINFFGEPKYFSDIYVWSGIWQDMGWSSIIYLAALAGVDPTLHDVATVDGANKIKRIWYIDIPTILPTVVILLIMSVGKVLNVGFQKIVLMQNPLNMAVSEVIDTYVYNVGIAASMPDYSYATAIGLFKSVVGLIMVLAVNKLSKVLTETSLW